VILRVQPTCTHLCRAGTFEMKAVLWSRFSSSLLHVARCCVSSRLPSRGRSCSHALGQDPIQTVPTNLLTWPDVHRGYNEIHVQPRDKSLARLHVSLMPLG
jgi:hypothetical protein